MLREMSSLILRHTRLSRSHLTPSLALRLITPDCPLWHGRVEEVPFDDPFWAFYWPGGQATARYILDNGDVVRNMNVIDIGCGCGAGAIAAAKMKANYVVANDIDPCALEATKLNASLNEVTLSTNDKDFIGTDCEDFDVVLVGDMFYDEEFANKLFLWLRNLTAMKKTVLIGDPGRHGLTVKRRAFLNRLASYSMPSNSRGENHGYTETAVWTINK